MLRYEGYEASGFSNAREAIHRLEGGHQSDVILLDLMMPVMNGWEFCDYRAEAAALAQSACDRHHRQTSGDAATRRQRRPAEAVRRRRVVRCDQQGPRGIAGDGRPVAPGLAKLTARADSWSLNSPNRSVPPNIPGYENVSRIRGQERARNISSARRVWTGVNDERAVRVLAIAGSLRRASSNRPDQCVGTSEVRVVIAGRDLDRHVGARHTRRLHHDSARRPWTGCGRYRRRRRPFSRAEVCSRRARARCPGDTPGLVGCNA